MDPERLEEIHAEIVELNQALFDIATNLARSPELRKDPTVSVRLKVMEDRLAVLVTELVHAQTRH